MAAKSTSDAYAPTTAFPPDPNSTKSTISTVEREIKEAGGEALAISVDVRDFTSIQDLIRKTLEVQLPPPLFPPSRCANMCMILHDTANLTHTTPP